jgi:hypothetical protein
MRLGYKILAWIVGVLLVLVVALILFVAFFDWNRLKPTIDDKVSAAIGRSFVINGDLPSRRATSISATRPGRGNRSS